MSLYRKYRPSTFDELVAQDMSVFIIRDAAREDKIGHAYLLSGPRGVGKTTTARLIAKVVNCEKRRADKKFHKEGNPCNECRACSEIDEGRALDVIEIDAASNRGIDEVRNLKESIRLAPASLVYKVYIIDEVHMMTKDAFNALLKTLEEPPVNTIFVLATTETEKIPATIVSRVQHFHFKRIPREGIVKKLLKIAKEEELDISLDAIELIAAYAEGGMRDAESLLEHFIAFGEKSVSLTDVERVIGKVGFRRVAEFSEKLLKRDMDGSLQLLATVNDEGHNLAQFARDVIEHLRRVAVIKAAPSMKENFKNEMMSEHLEILEKQSLIFDERALETLKGLIGAYGQMKYSQFAIIPLEIAIIESLK